MNLYEIEKMIKTCSIESIIGTIQKIKRFNKTRPIIDGSTIIPRMGSKAWFYNQVLELLWSELKNRGIKINSCDPAQRKAAFRIMEMD